VWLSGEGDGRLERIGLGTVDGSNCPLVRDDSAESIVNDPKNRK